MKSFLNQALTLGGLFFIILMMAIPMGQFFNFQILVFYIIPIIFLIAFMVLCIKKSFCFISIIHQKNKLITYGLNLLGFFAYVYLFLMSYLAITTTFKF